VFSFQPWSRIIKSLPWLLGLLGFFLMLFTACRQQTENSSRPLEKVTIAYPTVLQAALFHVAFTKGFFSAEGLEVTAQPHEFGKLALNSLLEGKADVATATDTPIMFAITGGRRVYILAILATDNKAVGIVARKDRGIGNPSDLKGKQIGVARGTTSEFFLDSFLSTRGMERKEVKIVDLKPHEMPEALAQGKVEAVAIWNPALKNSQKALGDKALVFYDETVCSDIFCLAAGSSFIEQHPETVKKILRALLRAEAFTKQNPDEARRLIAQFIQADQGLLGEIWNSSDFRVTLDQSLIVSLEDQTRWAQRNKLTSGMDFPNYLDFIYLDGLQSVKPEAIRIIR
jgi:ABC-type nitrate/sulfonate/bicarbonate transport system substrate-binding protein